MSLLITPTRYTTPPLPQNQTKLNHPTHKSTHCTQAEAALLESMSLLVEREEERVGEGIAVPKPSLGTHVAVLEKVRGAG